MITVAHFSYTGNTAYLATHLAKQLQLEPKQCVNLIDQDVNSIDACEHLVIFFAIHAFSPPVPLVKQLKALAPHRFKYISFVGVGCHDLSLNHGVFQPLVKLVTPKCEQVLLLRVLAMPLTLIKKMPDEQHIKTIEMAEQDIVTLAYDLKAKTANTYEHTTLHHILHQIGNIEKHAAKLFGLELYANKNCIHCGRCWLECPMKNITVSKHQTPKFHFNCSMCLKCIYDCPKQAISPRVSKFVLIKGGYDVHRYTR